MQPVTFVHHSRCVIITCTLIPGRWGHTTRCPRLQQGRIQGFPKGGGGGGGGVLSALDPTRIAGGGGGGGGGAADTKSGGSGCCLLQAHYEKRGGGGGGGGGGGRAVRRFRPDTKSGEGGGAV